jgi:hypothetical protein
MVTVDVAECPATTDAGEATPAESEKSGVGTKVAVAFRLASMVKVHTSEPEQAPLQPLKVKPDAAVAASETEVPMARLVEHNPGQLIPPRSLVTLPVPVPAIAAVRVKTGTTVVF